MKKNLIALVIVNVAAMAGISSATAQIASTSNSLEHGKNTIEINKTGGSVKNSAAELETISPRALKNFAHAYRNVRGESWKKIKEGFSVRFTSDDMRTTIFYDNNGYWLGSIKNYGEEKMPHKIRHTVKRTYYDFNIIYAQEVETADTEGIPTYIICLQDETDIKMIRICDGEMSVWKEFTKAK